MNVEAKPELTISARVQRAGSKEWVDLGVIATTKKEPQWLQFIRRLAKHLL